MSLSIRPSKGQDLNSKTINPYSQSVIPPSNQSNNQLSNKGVKPSQSIKYQKSSKAQKSSLKN